MSRVEAPMHDFNYDSLLAGFDVHATNNVWEKDFVLMDRLPSLFCLYEPKIGIASNGERYGKSHLRYATHIGWSEQ